MPIARFVAIVSFAVLTIPAHSDESGPIDEKTSACSELLSSMYRAKEQGWAPLESFRLLESQCESAQFYYQHRAQLESFVGNHRKALTYWDKNYSRRSEDQEILAGQERTTPAIEAENAISYIVDRSSDHRMVIVNERHHVSSDRLLTLALLEPLSRKGFRYLAVEAVWPGDGINQRGYPTKNTGYYINDVVFAEMLRVALSLGYEIVWYEIEEDQKSLPDPRGPQARRDYWQARNLVGRTLAKDSEARVLVHCGWGHASEQASPEFQPMAHFVREIAGIDPLTVDQTTLGEHSEAGFERPLRIEAHRQGLMDSDPIVLSNEDGNLPDISTGMDIHVLSPPTRYREGRPAWMDMRGRRRPVTVGASECSDTTCVVEARNADRPDEVAYDRVEVSERDAVELYLPHDANVELFLFDLGGELRARRKLPN